MSRAILLTYPERSHLTREQMEAHLRLHGWEQGSTANGYYAWGKDGVVTGENYRTGKIFNTYGTLIQADYLTVSDEVFFHIAWVIDALEGRN